MNFGMRSGIVVDVCRSDGTWFDCGELDAALEFVASGGLEGRQAPPEPPPDAQMRRMLGLAEFELRAEAQHEELAIRRATGVSGDDLVSLLVARRYATT
jgi:hypothetical protein